MGAIGRQLSIVALGTVLGAFGRDAAADDAACQTVLDAIIQQAAVPVHQKISIESTAAPGKPLANWGLHLIDVNLAMGNLLDLVEAQSKAYRSRK